MKRYDEKNPESIEKHGKLLENKTLRELYNINSSEINTKNKGNLGQLVEKYHFEYKPNSDQNPDFLEAGVELKVTPLRKIKENRKSNLLMKQKGLSVKERVSVTMIDYNDLVKETWDANSLYKKIRHILFPFYMYEKDVNLLDLRFDLVSLWKPSQNDLKIIKKDWETIKKKVEDGKAHELSEGDTLYLGAAIKGSSAKSLRTQPFSKIVAKQRTFSLKRSYVDFIYEELLNKNIEDKNKNNNLENSILIDEDNDIYSALKRIFKPFYGLSAYEIKKKLGINLNLENKSYLATLMKNIMKIQNIEDVEEFKKANIQLKTVRITPNNSSKESISFPSFKFIELANEEWETSRIKRTFDETKFLFTIFNIDTSTTKDFDNMSAEEQSKHLILKEVKLWNMPYEDLEKLKLVWKKTKKVINNGIEIKEVPWGKKMRRENNFPKSTESKVAHIRPHGQTVDDTYPLPSGGEFTKQCFFLNAKYIVEICK